MKRLLLFLLALGLCSPLLFAGRRGKTRIEAIPYRAHTGDPAIDTMCLLDLCCPGGEGFATVVWFHGGGLAGGRREIPQELAGQGLAVAGVDYRLVPGVGVRECIDDAAAAAAWVVRHIASYGGDPRKIFVAGHSAGGYLTSMIGLDKRWMARYGIDPDTAFLALVPYSGQTITHFARRRELGKADTEPWVDDLAPLSHVRPDAPPMLLLSGDRELEMLGRYEETAYFWRMMRVAGHRDVRLLEFDGYDHGNMPQAGHPAAVRYIREKLSELSADSAADSK